MSIRTAAVAATTLAAALTCTLVGAASAQADAGYQHTGAVSAIVVDAASGTADWPWGLASAVAGLEDTQNGAG